MFLMKKRRKLHDKGGKCIFLGLGNYSKAYKLYNPITKKIIVSRYAIFYKRKKTWIRSCNIVPQIISNIF